MLQCASKMALVYIAKIFLSRKLNVLAHTIHTNIHTDINIIYPSPHTHTHHGQPILWKCLLKKDRFELGFGVREGGEIPQAGRQQIPDSWGNETERTVTNRFEIAFRDFQESNVVVITAKYKSYPHHHYPPRKKILLESF